MKIRTPNRHMLRCMIAIQEYRNYITITHRPGKLNNNADGLGSIAFPDFGQPWSYIERLIMLISHYRHGKSLPGQLFYQTYYSLRKTTRNINAIKLTGTTTDIHM